MSQFVPEQHEVVDHLTFYHWARSITGMPSATIKDIGLLQKTAKKFFEENPGTDWQTLCKVVLWCKAKRIRCKAVWGYVMQYSKAWADGVFDLDMTDDLSIKVQEALELETDPAWRSRLQRVTGSARAEVLREWQVTKQLAQL